jgi:3-oxoacyl-[acyl-carrier protein] reductase
MDGRVALVTGSTSGIGLGIAQRFGREGAAVVVTGRRRELGEEVAAKIVADGGTAAFFPADLTDPDAGAEMVTSAVDHFGRLDTIVNNAADPGSARAVDGPLEKNGVDYWDAMYRSSVRSALVVTKAALPALKASGKGRIVNISSIMAIRGGAWDTYAWAKAAIIGLTRSMAVSYAADDITVNCIAVGSVVVERTAESWQQDASQRFWSRVGLTRVGIPEDIAHPCVWLGSDEAEYVTGAVVVVDGGMDVKGIPVAMSRPQG